MRLREHEAVKSKSDQFQVDPRLLRTIPGFNIRNLDAAEERAELDELKEQVRGRGVRRPLVVRMEGDDIVLVDGHRRLMVALELIAEGEPIDTVPAIQEAPGTGAEERILNLKLMNSGKPLTRQQDAEIVRRLKGYGWDDKKIAQGMGWKSVNSVHQALDIAEFSQRLNQHISAGHISATEARKSVKSVGDDKTCEIIEQNLAQKTGKGSTTKPPRVKPADMAKANPKKLTKAEQAAAERRQQALDALPAERRALVLKGDMVKVGGNVVPFEFVTESEWAEILGTPRSAEAAAFAGNGTHEYTPPADVPAEPPPLPTDAATSPQAVSDGPQPEAAPPSHSVDEAAPAAEPSQEPPAAPVAKPLTHLTNGAFFKAVEPVAELIEGYDLTQFTDEDSVGINIPVPVAKQFLTAINRARGVS